MKCGYTYDELEAINKVRADKQVLQGLSAHRAKTGSTDPYVYQYRTLESFWSIIESDSFWATNARFSNDHEEQSLGMKKLREFLGMDVDADAAEALGDCYIVCFCDEDDKLSQWRGYAPEGVSIGFDFNNVRPFYIQRREGTGGKEEFVQIYNSCYKVQYISEDTKKNIFAQKFYLNPSADKLSIGKVPDFISYVKHIGFHEEAESRLVFSDRDTDLSGCIHYRSVGDIKVPYIIVKADGGETCKGEACIVRLNFEAGLGETLEKGLSEHFSRSKTEDVTVVNCVDIAKGEADDSLCFGCSLREAYIPGVNGRNPDCRYAHGSKQSFHVRNNNQIYISNSRNQEEVYQEVQTFFQKQDGELKKTKIWCEGHLPIRSITVGNLRNKEIVAESIRHYCSQHYWLRSVDVRASATPFRSSLI